MLVIVTKMSVLQLVILYVIIGLVTNIKQSIRVMEKHMFHLSQENYSITWIVTNMSVLQDSLLYVIIGLVNNIKNRKRVFI